MNFRPNKERANLAIKVVKQISEFEDDLYKSKNEMDIEEHLIS